MGRLRYIEPELWDNPDLRRLGFVARDVFVYLFARAADDEGRFRWEPFAILEATFSRNDPVTEDGVAAALDGLAEAGMLVRYGDRGEFGFLTGWFAHQAMDGRWRRGSNLPRPPVEVGSWQEADAVREAYAKAEKKTGRNVSYRESLRWSREHRGTLSEPSPENLARISRREGEGVRGKENDQDLAPPANAEAALLVLESNDPGIPEKKPRKESEKQRLIRLAYEKLTGQPVPNAKDLVAVSFWKAVNKVMNVNGIDPLKAWVQWRLTNGKLMPEGCIPKDWFPAEYRKAMQFRRDWEGKT